MVSKFQKMGLFWGQPAMDSLQTEWAGNKNQTKTKIPENIMFIHIVNVTNSLLQMISCILDLLKLPWAILIDRRTADSVHLS